MVKEQEIWKTYPEIPFIEASNLGRIRTKDRVVTGKDGKKYHIKGRVLKQRDRGYGYLFVHLSVNGEQVSLYVHRVIATCFLPNPLGLPEVNHIDNDPTNNAVNNLEWCTRKYNEAYKKKFGTSQAEVLGRAVVAVNPETSEVFWFKTQSEAARQLGVNQGNINSVVKGKKNIAGNYWFCYADSTAVEKTRSKFGDEIANKVEELIREHL